MRRFRKTYTDVPVEDKQAVVPAEEFNELLAVHQDDYIGGAYAWIVRSPTAATDVSESYRQEPGASKRALFLLPRASNTWGLPGGGQEGKELFDEAVVREIREETGVQCEVTVLWLLRRLEGVSDDEDDDRSTHSVQGFSPHSTQMDTSRSSPAR